MIEYPQNVYHRYNKNEIIMIIILLLLSMAIFYVGKQKTLYYSIFEFLCFCKVSY
jgi:hypothetical protein